MFSIHWFFWNVIILSVCLCLFIVLQPWQDIIYLIENFVCHYSIFVCISNFMLPLPLDIRVNNNDNSHISQERGTSIVIVGWLYGIHIFIYFSLAVGNVLLCKLNIICRRQMCLKNWAINDQVLFQIWDMVMSWLLRVTFFDG